MTPAVVVNGEVKGGRQGTQGIGNSSMGLCLSQIGIDCGGNQLFPSSFDVDSAALR